MLCIDNNIVDPYFNLAAEEHLLKNYSSNIFMLWQNEPSVIIGKNQDVWSEINTSFIKDKNIKVVRRYTGGGAVYHDLGNINITFSDNGIHADFSKYTKRIQNLLDSLGVDSSVNKNGAILLNQLKISGSALCIHQNRTLFHATLLFSSNLADVTSALDSENRVNQKKKYVKSNRSSVTNISEHITHSLTMDDFRKIIFNFFLKENTVNISHTFNNEDIQTISKLSKEKYATTAWTFNQK